MDVVRGKNGKYVIIHAGREVDKDFDTEGEAWHWADANIDDQVFDDPNWFTDKPISYRTPPPNPRTQ
jgi:hypothetical protein